jgi:glycosyltransferase involved in cell wall biosynthesis
MVPRAHPSERKDDLAREFSGYRIGVIIPAFRVAPQIEQVIRGIPAWIRKIIVIDDKSPDDTAARVTALRDERVILIRHPENRGVGGAMRSGFQEAMRQDLELVVKMDGDDQMDPVHLPELLRPLIDGQADMTKGNRYVTLSQLRSMPMVRVVGNAGLAFLMKIASGYWTMLDPANGYFAIRTEVLRRIDLNKLHNRFFFESGLLIKLGILRAVVKDVSIPARYGNEHSSLSIRRTLIGFPPRLVVGLLRRILWRYFLYDFTAVSVFLLIGVPTLFGGILFGAWIWYRNHISGAFTSAGEVMLAAMPVLLGANLLLQAIVLDVQGIPRNPISPPLPPRRKEAV